MKKDPFENLVLTDEEREIEESMERGEWVEVENIEERKKELQQAAREHILARRAKPVTIRVNTDDLEQLKARAEQANIPYQTLLGALIRHYVRGDYELKI